MTSDTVSPKDDRPRLTILKGGRDTSDDNDLTVTVTIDLLQYDDRMSEDDEQRPRRVRTGPRGV